MFSQAAQIKEIGLIQNLINLGLLLIIILILISPGWRSVIFG